MIAVTARAGIWIPTSNSAWFAPYHSEKPEISKATSIGSFAIAAGVRGAIGGALATGRVTTGLA